jgi:hypothetical protein
MILVISLVSILLYSSYVDRRLYLGDSGVTPVGSCFIYSLLRGERGLAQISKKPMTVLSSSIIEHRRAMRNHMRTKSNFMSNVLAPTTPSTICLCISPDLDGHPPRCFTRYV